MPAILARRRILQPLAPLLAAPVPTLGAELIVNPGMESGFTGGIANNWSANNGGSAVFADETTIIHAGAHSQKVTAAANLDGLYKNPNPGSAGNWYQVSTWVYPASGSKPKITYGLNVTATGSAAWEKLLLTTSYPGGNRPAVWGTGAGIFYIDDVSMMQLSTPSMFSTYREQTINKTLAVNLTLTANTQAGLVVCLDNPANPQNMILAYHDGTNAHLDKCVNGTWTSLISAAATYAARRELKIIKTYTTCALYYNGTQIGTTQTISDASVINNRFQGLFSTLTSNSFDSFNSKAN